MHLFMSGLEHSLVSIPMREKLSFSPNHVGQMVKTIRAFPGVEGCVLISTCNRTELYLSGSRELEPGKLLCRAAGVDYFPYENAFRSLTGQNVLRHLMEVAAGLRSRIWGEDQIITQVKNAVALAREEQAADPVLETLFRSAVAAGKEIRSQIRLTTLPASAASMAVEKLQQVLGDLRGKKALVIGNGEMGRLSASLLQAAGCQVSVTLRTYHHGETIVPYGCGVVPYDQRFTHMDGTEILVSATTSPHYTVTREQLNALPNPPAILVDLAIPRDIQPEVGEVPGTQLFNIDDLGNYSQNRVIPPEVEEILAQHQEHFYRWLHYRDCMSARESLKEAIVRRIEATAEGETDPKALVSLSVDKAVDLIMGGLAECITPEALARCESKIRAHTIPR